MHRFEMMLALVLCCSACVATAVAADPQKEGVSPSPEAAAAAIRIGWASEDITPPRPVFLRGQRYPRLSEGVGDPLTVTAMAIESGGGGRPPQQAIMMSCDLISVSAETLSLVREAMRDRLPGFDVNMLLLSATHTHTGPGFRNRSRPEQDTPLMTGTEYRELFVRKATDAAARAWNSRQPAGVSWAYGHAMVGHNRRMVYADGSAEMYGRTYRDDFISVEGYEDHGVNLLCGWDAQGKITGMVINLACPSQAGEHGKLVSADFWYETRQELRKRFGEKLFILPQCSAAGDQSPHVLINEAMHKAVRERKAVTTRQEIAHRIASAVADVFGGARADIQTELVFRHEVRTLELPRRMVTEREMERARQSDDQRIMRRYEAQKEASPYSMELHVLRLGSVAIATNPFELFLDFGTRIKARSAAMQTFVVQLACGSGGYVPTEKATTGGGYGAELSSNRVGAVGGGVLVDRTVELIKEMWD